MMPDATNTERHLTAELAGADQAQVEAQEQCCESGRCEVCAPDAPNTWTAPVPRPAEEPDREALRDAIAGSLRDLFIKTRIMERDVWRQAADHLLDGPLALLPTPPAPGGGGADLRGEVERLTREADQAWADRDEWAAIAERALAALTARDADPGAVAHPATCSFTPSCAACGWVAPAAPEARA